MSATLHRSRARTAVGARRASRSRALAAALLLLAACTAPAGAQLRPLDPFDWRIFDPAVDLIVAGGTNVLWEQTAPLAGARGTLTEIATYQLLWRSGRVGLELGGTALLRFSEDTAFRAPAPGVERATDGVRQDPGPVLVGTIVRLTPERWPAGVALRFGTRIPTTSDESGLERDRTDFYALVGARWQAGAWSVAGESGVGINGARAEDYPQSDVWMYSLHLEHERAHYALFAAVTGHQDGHSWTPPTGNEDQGELRAGLRLGRRWWIRPTYVHGFRGPAPAHGLLLSAGVALGCRSDCLPFN